MEDIIVTVLALALGLGFKIVEKKLKGKAPRIPEAPDISLVSEVDEDAVEVLESAPAVAPAAAPAAPPAVARKSPAVAPVKSTVKAPVRKPKKMVADVETPKVREKIDPKKLIVYSEIMTPKFKQENQ